MNVLRSVMSGQISASADALERVLGVRGPLHELQYARAAVLERDVEVRQHLASAISGMTSSTCGYG